MDETLICDCGSMRFNLLKNGMIECDGCQKHLNGGKAKWTNEVEELGRCLNHECHKSLTPCSDKDCGGRIRWVDGICKMGKKSVDEYSPLNWCQCALESLDELPDELKMDNDKIYLARGWLRNAIHS